MGRSPTTPPPTGSSLGWAGAAGPLISGAVGSRGGSSARRRRCRRPTHGDRLLHPPLGVGDVRRRPLRGGLQLRLDDTVGIRSERRTGRRTYFVREGRVVTPALRAKLLGRRCGYREAGSPRPAAPGARDHRRPPRRSRRALGERGWLPDRRPGPAAGRRRRAARPGAGQQAAGDRFEVEARLDLRDPENAGAARRLLGALDRPDRPAAARRGPGAGRSAARLLRARGAPLPPRRVDLGRRGKGQGRRRPGRRRPARQREGDAGRRLGPPARRGVAVPPRLPARAAAA